MFVEGKHRLRFKRTATIDSFLFAVGDSNVLRLLLGIPLSPTHSTYFSNFPSSSDAGRKSRHLRLFPVVRSAQSVRTDDLLLLFHFPVVSKGGKQSQPSGGGTIKPFRSQENTIRPISVTNISVIYSVKAFSHAQIAGHSATRWSTFGAIFI